MLTTNEVLFALRVIHACREKSNEFIHLMSKRGFAKAYRSTVRSAFRDDNGWHSSDVTVIISDMFDILGSRTPDTLWQVAPASKFLIRYPPKRVEKLIKRVNATYKKDHSLAS